MLKISQVSKSFGSFKTLDDVTIEVQKGSIYGIIGENGAGKTTLIKSITGIYKIDEGEITLDGQPIYENNENKQKIGYVADQNQYFKNYKIKELIRFYEEVYPLFDRMKFDEYNKRLKIDINKKVYQISKGMQMRLSLMLNLALQPELLILDEPTSGLDAIVKKEIMDMIIEEVDTRQMTVFISSHHLNELEKICDEMSIINKGVITYQSSVDELKEKVKKLQVVFEGDAPADIRKWSEVLDVSQIGSVYYVVSRDYSYELEQKLRAYGVKLLEVIPLTLEEIFIYTNKERED